MAEEQLKVLNEQMPMNSIDAANYMKRDFEMAKNM